MINGRIRKLVREWLNWSQSALYGNESSGGYLKYVDDFSLFSIKYSTLLGNYSRYKFVFSYCYLYRVC